MIHALWNTFNSFLGSSLFATLATGLSSAALASFFGLWTYRHQAKELIDGAVTWQWGHHHDGRPDELPFLVLQNRSAVPAFLVRARYLRGVFFRTEADNYAFSYVDVEAGSFPLPVKAQDVTSFPLSTRDADKLALKASRFSRWCGYLTKRPYLWIEVTTISGRRLVIPANDAVSFNKRPLWLEGRWLPRPRLDWLN